MSEWEVFCIIAALVGFAVTICTPIVKLNTSIIKLIERLNNLDEGLDELTERNHKSHDRMWKHNEKQDGQLTDHEKRIIVLEKEK